MTESLNITLVATMTLIHLEKNIQKQTEDIINDNTIDIEEFCEINNAENLMNYIWIK